MQALRNSNAFPATNLEIQKITLLQLNPQQWISTKSICNSLFVEYKFERNIMRKLLSLSFLPKEAIYDEINSPVGKLTIITSVNGLHAILWDTDRKSIHYEKIIHNLKRSQLEDTIVQTKKQLEEYFHGTRKTFNLPLVIKGTTFQIQAWQQLLKIPYATTISYAKQAEQVGNKNKARAVGMANGLNPISIIIPCHRVVGSNGSLVGFGGGLEKKEYLLKLEQKWSNNNKS